LGFKPFNGEYYILWQNQSQSEEANALLENKKLRIPRYLKKEIKSRYGRPGRARLWCPSSFPEGICVNPWPDTELGHELAGRRGYGLDAGGIVFKKKDLEIAKQIPGTITDLELNQIEENSVICATENQI